MANKLEPVRDCNLSPEQLQAILNGIAANRTYGFNHPNVKWRLRWSGLGRNWDIQMNKTKLNTLPGDQVTDQEAAAEIASALNRLKKIIEKSQAGKAHIAAGATTIVGIRIQIYLDTKTAKQADCGNVDYPVNTPNTSKQ